MLERRWPETDLYAITASQFSLGRSNVEVVRQLLAADIKIIQYREKEFSMQAKYQECRAIRELTAAAKACFIVNDDVDLALAVGADGVHVGQDDLPPDMVRKLVGAKMLIGLSTHSPEQMQQARQDGIADYLGVGPLFQTFTKKDVMPPVGLGYLDYAAENCRLPFVAIGGIKEQNVGEVVQHGAKCICLVTEIVGAQNIEEKVRSIRTLIKNNNQTK
jgi:thiamine-phosphate pyrophosphorylase